MQKILKGLIAPALVCAVIITMGSCQQGVATDDKPGDPPKLHEAQITADKETGKWTIPTITVRRGEQVRFNSGSIKIWMLLPADFNYVKGNATSCKTEAFLAVAIDQGGHAIIEVPFYFEIAGEDQTIRYAFMVRERDGAAWEDWQYGHGPNTPPAMIIRR
jgi:hypothetical protein